jgi:hypothetical protein
MLFVVIALFGVWRIPPKLLWRRIREMKQNKNISLESHIRRQTAQQ